MDPAWKSASLTALSIRPDRIDSINFYFGSFARLHVPQVPRYDHFASTVAVVISIAARTCKSDAGIRPAACNCRKLELN